MSEPERHWERVHREKAPELASWFQDRPAVSLELIESLDPPHDAPIVDVGGGASTLVDHLLARGFIDITVVDIAPAALAAAKGRLGEDSARAEWVVADVTTRWRSRPVAIWHDRAVFHFLVEPGLRERYLETLRACVAPGGHVVLATFAPNGPAHCSGLPVQRYDVGAMGRVLGDGFELIERRDEVHRTPRGGEQAFAWGAFRRVVSAGATPANGHGRGRA